MMITSGLAGRAEPGGCGGDQDDLGMMMMLKVMRIVIGLDGLSRGAVKRIIMIISIQFNFNLELMMIMAMMVAWQAEV